MVCQAWNFLCLSSAVCRAWNFASRCVLLSLEFLCFNFVVNVERGVFVFLEALWFELGIFVF